MATAAVESPSSPSYVAEYFQRPYRIADAITAGIKLPAEWAAACSGDLALKANAGKVVDISSKVSSALFIIQAPFDVANIATAVSEYKKSEEGSEERYVAKKTIATSVCDLTGSLATGVEFFDSVGLEVGRAASSALGVVGNTAFFIGEAIELVDDCIRVDRMRGSIMPLKSAELFNKAADIAKRIVAIALAAVSLVAIGFVIAGLASPISPFIILGLSSALVALKLFTYFYDRWLQDERHRVAMKPASVTANTPKSISWPTW